MVEKTLEGIEAKLEEIRAMVLRLEQRLKPEPTCLTYPEAAARLGIGLTKLKRMVKAGELRKTYLSKGGAPMIALSEIHRISTPEPERPALEAKSRAASWQPIPRKKRR